MANLFPVIAICVTAAATSLGAGVLAAVAPNSDRACQPEELVAEQFFAIATPDDDGARRVSYFVELANPQARPQVFNLAFDLADAPDRRTGDRAVSLTGGQTMPMLLGQQKLEGHAAPLPAEAIAEAVRMTCRGW